MICAAFSGAISGRVTSTTFALPDSAVTVTVARFSRSFCDVTCAQLTATGSVDVAWQKLAVACLRSKNAGRDLGQRLEIRSELAVARLFVEPDLRFLSTKQKWFAAVVFVENICA